MSNFYKANYLDKHNCIICTHFNPHGNGETYPSITTVLFCPVCNRCTALAEQVANGLGIIDWRSVVKTYWLPKIPGVEDYFRTIATGKRCDDCDGLTNINIAEMENIVGVYDLCKCNLKPLKGLWGEEE